MWSEFSEKTDPTRRVRQSLRSCVGEDGVGGVGIMRLDAKGGGDGKGGAVKSGEKSVFKEGFTESGEARAHDGAEWGKRLMLQCRDNGRYETMKYLRENRAEKPKKRERGRTGRLGGAPEPEAPEVAEAPAAAAAEGEDEDAPAPADAARSVVLRLEEPAKLRLKLRVPPSWFPKPASKLAATLAKHAAAKGTPVDAASLAMYRKDGSRLKGSELLATVDDGETIAMRPRKPKAAAA